MGSDLYLNPPPLPPIWEQVKALHDRNAEMTKTIGELKGRIHALEGEKEALERAVARLTVQVEGRPFSWEQDHIEPEDREEGDPDPWVEVTPDGRVIDPTTGKEYTTPHQPWCTCGARTPQGMYHAHDCPAYKKAMGHK